jgi:four helix bundle protein
MEIVKDSYGLAQMAKPSWPLVARHLRRAAVAVPANVAEALAAEGSARRDNESRAKGALAEIERQTIFLLDDPGLAREADALAAKARRSYQFFEAMMDSNTRFS